MNDDLAGNRTRTIRSDSPDKTLAIGCRIGVALVAGDVLGLVGQLGAGKTMLVKGIADGLGIADGRHVNSPTFVLVNEYEGRLLVYHIDVYRLTGAEEFAALGFDEMRSSDGVIVIEWADRVAAELGPETLWIDLSITGETERDIVLRTSSEALASRLAGAGLDRYT